MSEPTTGILFNSTVPAAPAGYQNIRPQSDGGVPLQSVSFYAQAAGGVNSLTDDYTAVAADAGKLLSFNNGGSPGTLLLPNPPPSATWCILVENVGTGILTVSPNGLEIDDDDPAIPLGQDEGLYVTTDGTNYFTQRGAGGGGTGGGAGSLQLEVNGNPNGSQSLLNLVEGTGITISDDGSGDITISAGGAPSNTDFVQGATSYAADLSPAITCAFVSDNAVGNCLIVDVVATEQFANAGSFSISDSRGNVYSPVINEEQNNVRAMTFVALNCAAGPNTVTISYATSNLTTYPIVMAIHEYSGVATVEALDTSTYAQAASTSQLPMVPSLTTTAAGDLLHLFCGCIAYSGPEFTQSESWNERESLFTSGTEVPEITTFDMGAPAAGTYSDTVTISGSGTPTYMSAYLIALKAQTTGGTASTLQPYQEVPAGAIDGSNRTFTLTRAPAANTLIYNRNGVVQNPFGGTPDFVLSGYTITTTTPLEVGVTRPDWHWAQYWA